MFNGEIYNYPELRDELASHDELFAKLGARLPAALQPDGLRLAAGFACVTFGALMLLWLVAFFATQIIRANNLSLADRTIGAIFGLVRGVLIAHGLAPDAVLGGFDRGGRGRGGLRGGR